MHDRGSPWLVGTMFTDTVRASVAKSDAPKFDMPQKADFDSGDIGLDVLTPDRGGALATSG